jgi:hypothetical protein
MRTDPDNQTQYIRRSAEQWQEIMTAYEASGLTQESFCIRESLAPSTFYTWRQRLGGAKTIKPEKPLFVELSSSQPMQESTHWDIELVLGDNIVLRLRQSN